jgi:hypothetical protein
MASVAKPTIASHESASTPLRHERVITPSLRATLVEGLSQMFAFERGGSVKAVCLFDISVATLSWAVNLLLPLVQEANQYLIGWSSGSAPAHLITEP